MTALASSAYAAPMLGIFMTVEALPFWFRGCCGEKSAMLAALAWYLSEAIKMMLPGFALGIAAMSVHHYLTGRVLAMVLDMEATVIELANWLELSEKR